MAYDETKAYQCLSDKNSEPQKTYVLSAIKQWMFSRESPKSYILRYGKPPTTISLRESKATSLWWKKNVAPVLR